MHNALPQILSILSPSTHTPHQIQIHIQQHDSAPHFIAWARLEEKFFGRSDLAYDILKRAVKTSLNDVKVLVREFGGKNAVRSMVESLADDHAFWAFESAETWRRYGHSCNILELLYFDYPTIKRPPKFGPHGPLSRKKEGQNITCIFFAGITKISKAL